jgi:menaquinone-dependent protoporphyrinogen oxidase
MQLYYATRDGHSRRIAERIASRLGEQGVAAVPRDLAAPDLPQPDGTQSEGTGPVVVVMAVRYGKHLPEAERFLARLGHLAVPPPLVLLSVNLTARKPGRDTLERCTYLKKTIRRHALRPVLARAFGGRLDYARYGLRDRLMIRFIMWLTGGPTHSGEAIEYTDWGKVDSTARDIAALCKGANPS